MSIKEDLLAQKLAVDAELADANIELAHAKANARAKSRYLPPEQYANLLAKVKRLGLKSQALQLEMNKLKPAKLSTVLFSDCFEEAAREILTKDEIHLIRVRALEIKRRKEEIL